MGCILLGKPDDTVAELQRRLKLFSAFALAHQEWEADVLSDDSPWFDDMPEVLRQKFGEVQQLRNQALGLD